MNSITSLFYSVDKQEATCFAKTLCTVAVITAVALIVIGALALIATFNPACAFAILGLTFGQVGSGAMIACGALLLSAVLVSVCYCRKKGDVDDKIQSEEPPKVEIPQLPKVEIPQPPKVEIPQPPKPREWWETGSDDGKKLELPNSIPSNFNGVQFTPKDGNKTGAQGSIETNHGTVDFEEL